VLTALILLGGSLVVTSSGCFAIADLGRFHQAVDGQTTDDPNTAWDLKLTLNGMGVHLNQLIEFRIIDSENYVQTRGVIDPVNDVASESVTFTVPQAILVGNRPNRLDFYADVNKTRSFDGLDTGTTHDHAWRIDPLEDFPPGKVSHIANSVQVVFLHNTVFTDINEWPAGTPNPPRDTGLGFLIDFPAADMAEFVGKLLQVRVVVARSGHVVGLYRNPQIPANDFSGFVPGVVESGEDYNIDVYVDANGNGVYDNPQSVGANLDLGWRFTDTAHFPSADEGGLGDGSADGAAGDDAGATAGAPVGLYLKFDPKSKPGVENVGEP
jgi:hypothetical protein